MIGAAVLGIGYLVAFLMDAPWQLLVASCVASAGVGIGYAAMPTLILDSVPLHEAASAVGINALMRSIGTTLASAVMAALLTSSTTLGGFEVPTEPAFRLCFVVGAAAAFVGVVIAATIPRSSSRREPRRSRRWRPTRSPRRPPPARASSHRSRPMAGSARDVCRKPLRRDLPSLFHFVA